MISDAAMKSAKALPSPLLETLVSHSSFQNWHPSSSRKLSHKTPIVTYVRDQSCVSSPSSEETSQSTTHQNGFQDSSFSWRKNIKVFSFQLALWWLVLSSNTVVCLSLFHKLLMCLWILIRRLRIINTIRLRAHGCRLRFLSCFNSSQHQKTPPHSIKSTKSWWKSWTKPK